MKEKETELTVEYDEVDSIAKMIQNKVVGAVIFAYVTKAEKKLAEIFRGRLSNIPVEKHQCAAGWMSWEDKKIFAHDEHIQVEQSLKMQTGKKFIFKQNLLYFLYAIFTEILRLAPIQVIAPMIVVCLLGPLLEERKIFAALLMENRGVRIFIGRIIKSCWKIRGCRIFDGVI